MNVLVVAPHPDDEAVGCGGTILKHVSMGDRVTVLFVTSGELGVNELYADWRVLIEPTDPAYNGVLKEVKRKLRETEAGVCSQVFGTIVNEFLRLPDGAVQVEYDDELSGPILTWLNNYALMFNPGRVYGPNVESTHADHRAVAATLAESDLRSVLMYEIWSPFDKIDHLEDITSFATQKRAAIRAYKSQLGNAYDDAILALNHYRGLLHYGGSGVMYAEAFKKL